LQDQDDRPARAGRPSLLSSAAQADLRAEPERQRILSALDGAGGPPAGAPVRAARPRGRGWMWSGTVLAGLAAVALVVFVTHDGEEADPVAHRVAAPVVASAAPAAPATLKTEAVAAEGVTPTPVPAPPEAPARTGIDPTPANPLADMAPAPVPAHAHARADTVTQALENRPAHRSPAARPQREVKRTTVAQAKPVHKAARQRAQDEADSDVVLLAALMSHMDTRNRKATVAERLDTCKRYNAAGEAQCRARVCAAEHKDPACRKAQGTQAAPDT